MVKWTENINGEPYTSRGVRTVRGRVFGDPTVVIQKGAGRLAYLISLKVQADGRRIDTQNIGRNQSRTMCVALEKKYGLVVSKGLGEQQKSWLKPVNPHRAKYGKTETKRAMSNVLLTVLDTYQFGSLPELNALLRCFNLMADRGSENSRIFRNKGLVYHVLNEQGERVGVPVKASDFHFNPGLQALENTMPNA